MSIEIKGKSRWRRRRSGRSKLVTRIVITIITLLILGLIAGVAYVWYTGQQEPIAPEPFPERSNRPAQVVEKPKLKPEGPVGVSSQVFTSPVAQGDNASVTIRTRPEAACSITLTYKDNIRSTDAGLLPKTADEFGTAQWTWTVEASRPVGTWPVEITCGLGEMSGYLKLDLEVTPKTT